MGRKQKQGRGGDSRDRIVETTARLLRVQGYHATGLNQIIDESDAPKGSLYHYFPLGKEELAAEAMRLAGQGLLDRLLRALEQDLNLAIDTLVEVTIEELESSDYRDGCPLATVALETSCSSPPIRSVCAAKLEEIQEVLRGWLQRQGVDPERAAALSLLILATYEGALLLSKVHRSVEPLRLLAPQIKAYLRQSLPTPT